MFEFKPWPKIQRLKTNTVTISEKIDGTNACVVIQEGKFVGCQSRNKIIKPGDDNMGFASWAYERQELLTELGEGYHYGEWAGPGIQKNPHCLPEKRFYLFDTRRHEFHDQTPMEGIVFVVPMFYVGEYIKPDGYTKEWLNEFGVANGNQEANPEGVMYYFHAFRTHIKAPIRSADK